MDYIPNKQLFAAVMFARNMMRDGQYPWVANKVAARYYGFKTTAVAQYTGQVAGRINAMRNHGIRY
jgi:hypothetical protein